MKRIDLELSQPSPHFIGSWSIEPLSICDEVVNFFETHRSNHTKGRTAGGLSTESKNSTDLAIRPRDLELPDHEPLRTYIESLFDCYKDYLEQWPFLESVLPSAEVGSFNIQKYEPGGHFMKVHSERTTIDTSRACLDDLPE
jgi:prolyl 4-hydroxylase